MVHVHQQSAQEEPVGQSLRSGHFTDGEEPVEDRVDDSPLWKMHHKYFYDFKDY